VRALPVAVTLMGQARARRACYGPRATQIPADCNPEVYGEGFWSRVNAWAGQFALTGPAGIVQASRGARGRVMAWPAAGYDVLTAGGRRGEEDGQA
jgi:hypothetical protein